MPIFKSHLQNRCNTDGPPRRWRSRLSLETADRDMVGLWAKKKKLWCCHCYTLLWRIPKMCQEKLHFPRKKNLVIWGRLWHWEKKAKKSEWIRTEGRHWITQWNKTVRTERKSKQKSEQESERKSERKSKRKSDPNQNPNRNRNKDANGNKNKQKQKIHIKGKWHLINLKKMLKCPKETNNNI